MEKLKNTLHALFSELLQKKEWAMMFLSSRIRLWRSRLWTRKEEFHWSIESDMDYLMTSSPQDQERYWEDLVRRRNIIHQRTLS